MHLIIDSVQITSQMSLGILGVEGVYLDHPNTHVQFIMHDMDHDHYPTFMSSEFCAQNKFTRVSCVDGFDRSRTYLFCAEVTGRLRNSVVILRAVARKIRKHRHNVVEAWQLTQEEFDTFDMFADL